MPPARITSRSSTLSAPAAMPTTMKVSFGVGLAAPDRIRSNRNTTCSSSRFDTPGLFGQFHHRHQPRARHQVLVIELGGATAPVVGQSH
jgi:hypothetical protein